MLTGIKEGLPWITDYHILKNKRYILTSSSESEKTVDLWSLDSGTIVKSWKQKTLQQVVQIISAEYDLKSGDSKLKIPSSWFTTDIKLGVSLRWLTS